MPVDTEHFLAANDALVGDNIVPLRFDDWRVLEGLGVQAVPHRMEISLPEQLRRLKPINWSLSSLVSTAVKDHHMI